MHLYSDLVVSYDCPMDTRTIRGVARSQCNLSSEWQTRTTRLGCATLLILSPPNMHLRVVFKADLTGGLMQVEDAAQLGDHGFVQGVAFGGGVGG